MRLLSWLSNDYKCDAFMPLESSSKLLEFADYGSLFGKYTYRHFRFGAITFLNYFIALICFCCNSRLSGSKVNFFIVQNPGIISFFSLLIIRLFKAGSATCSMNALMLSENSLWLDKHFFIPYTLKLASTPLDALSHLYRKKLIDLVSPKLQYKIVCAPCSFTSSSSYNIFIPIHERTIDILFLGRFKDGKGLELLEAISGELTDYNVHICGYGPIRPKFGSASIYFTENPLKILGNTKIFLSLQKVSNYPSQSLLEAALCGCAIIATNVGETSQYFSKSQLKFIDYSKDELLKSIEELLHNASLLEQYSLVARTEIPTLHSVSRYSQYFIDNQLSC